MTLALKPKFDLVPQQLDTSCGAACFEAALRYFKVASLGETYWIERMAVVEKGYASFEAIEAACAEVNLGFKMRTNLSWMELIELEREPRSAIIVTWWFEDSGHYSLILQIDETSIVLMDPWLAREKEYLKMDRNSFEPLWKLRGARAIVLLQVS